jgi:lathosterol oxidase
MDLLASSLNYLKQLSLIELFILFLLENGLLIIVAVTIGFFLDGTLKKISLKISGTEILWTFSTLVFNTIITLAGFLLYKEGIIKMTLETNFFRILLDTLVLILGMDFLMYVFHYLIHNIRFVTRIHHLHHKYEAPTAITLFVLNPIEVLGFGSLWLLLIMVYHSSMPAVFIYLFLNLVMGIIGHLELEVIPASWSKKIFLRWIANTAFHNDHHKIHNRNYGFYTSFWDKLFGTMK